MKPEIDTRPWIRDAFRPDLVSVIIPTFNRSGTLGQAIQSVYKQTYRPIECIVVDDGSTDATSEILKNWIGRKEGAFDVRCLSQANAGAPAARNYGTEESHGEYIQYLDSDDLLYSKKIDAQVRVLKRFRNLEAIFGDWEEGTDDCRRFVQAYRSKDLVAQFLWGRCIPIHSFLMHRTLVQKTGPWDLELKVNQEIDFHLRAVLSGSKIVYKNTNCGLWRLHDGTRVSTGANRSKSIAKFANKWVKQLDFLDEMTPSRREALSNLIFHNAISMKGSDEASVLNDLLLSQQLDPDRKEFITPKMRAASAILGNRRAMAWWLRRALVSRENNNHGK